MNTQEDETIYINYRDKVPCFGSNPAADIKLMKAMSEDNISNGSQMLCSAIIFGVPAVASIIAIIYFICSL